jgi:hypothetical protein
MQAKQLGKRQSTSQFKDTGDVYNFEYKLQNALSLLDRAKITPHDKQKILDFRSSQGAESQQRQNSKVHPAFEVDRRISKNKPEKEEKSSEILEEDNGEEEEGGSNGPREPVDEN